MSGRLVRMCPQHDRVLEDRDDKVWCPVGHWSAKWKVKDRITGKETDGGEEGETPASAPTPLVRGSASEAFRKASSPAERAVAAAVAAAAPTKKTGTIQAQRFVSAAGAQLYVRLVKLPNAHYRATWQRKAPDGAMTSGALCDVLSEAEATEVFQAELANAAERGWTERGGSSRLQFMPIPSADERTAPKAVAPKRRARRTA